jgi:hypothetical protein
MLKSLLELLRSVIMSSLLGGLVAELLFMSIAAALGGFMNPFPGPLGKWSEFSSYFNLPEAPTFILLLFVAGMACGAAVGIVLKLLNLTIKTIYDGPVQTSFLVDSILGTREPWDWEDTDDYRKSVHIQLAIPTKGQPTVEISCYALDARKVLGLELRARIKKGWRMSPWVDQLDAPPGFSWWQLRYSGSARPDLN